MMENKDFAIIFSLEKYVSDSLTIIFYFYDVGTCNKYDIENYRFKGPHRVFFYIFNKSDTEGLKTLRRVSI